MESVVLRFLHNVASDPDSEVRCQAAEVLVQLLTRSSAEWGTQLLALINSILRKGLQVASKAKEDKVKVSVAVSGCGHQWVWQEVGVVLS